MGYGLVTAPDVACEHVDDALLRELTERTGKEPCRTLLPPLQRPVGELSTLRWQPEGCGKWIPSEFRLCVADARQSLPADTRTVGVYAREGSFYAQTMEDAGLELENGCRQSAFFHFQVHHPPMRNALPARACVSENPLYTHALAVCSLCLRRSGKRCGPRTPSSEGAVTSRRSSRS